MGANKTPLSLMSEANSQIAALQKSLAETAQQQKLNQEQLQSTQLQLEERNRQIAVLQSSGHEKEEEVAGIRQQLTDSQQQNQQQKEQIAQLTAARTATALDLAAAQALKNQALAKSEASLTESRKEVAALQTQVATLKAAWESGAKAQAEQLKVSEQLKKSQLESDRLAKDMLARNAGLAAENKTKDEGLLATKNSLLESQKQREELNKKWLEASDKLKAQEAQLAELRQGAKTLEPKSEGEVRSYALGTFWGHEVTQVLDKVKADGFPLDMTQVSSGVTDSLRGEFRLPREKIIAVLEAMNKQVLSQNKPAQSDKFLQAFSKKPGTQRAEMGYYYRISKKGQGKIGQNDKVAVSVKESLASGKVIKDMAQTGKVLALPLSEFPPLFSSAVGKLGDKGKLVMAVPPELAYGEQGRPPEIPPSSTMVYEITVVDVRPAGK
ncbi:MAG: FKBP-type peptidyl-prolyl cis-trans isomerase [Scandinavium sp.]|uniref:FKBP-type peptidyl-prolyl cis-trans isomerase n=1 Tax=Scandinavium sp. TaxID=2830653 RepID=UPI003F2CD966